MAAALSFYRLDQAPMHLSGDEAQFAVQARALAATGRDFNGRALPLFVNVIDPVAPERHGAVWFQPMLFYLVAASFKVLPVDEWAVRAPMPVIAALDIVLLFLVARRVFPHLWQAALAAALLLMTPAHVVYSRLALDYLCTVPFALGWLLCVVTFVQTGGRRLQLLALAGALLGAGFYSYIAAWVMMPLYLLVTWMLAYKTAERPAAAALVSSAGLAIALAAFAVWIWLHPGMLGDTLNRYGLAGGAPKAGGFDLHPLLDRVSLAWSYFNPAYLFLAGSSNTIESTRRVGVLLAPVAVLLAAGVAHLWRRRREPVQALLLAGLVCAPVAALVVNERYCSDRELMLLPFAALVATAGASALLAQRGPARYVAVVCGLLIPLQFGMFYRDYLGDYRQRVAGIFDPFDFRDIADAVIAADAVSEAPAVYLSPSLDYGAARWRFYLYKHQRDDLFARTRYLDARDAATLAPGSIVIVPARDPVLSAELKSRFTVGHTIVDRGGSPIALIVRITA